MKPPHLLPRFVPYKLVLQEVAYQTVIKKVKDDLLKIRKLYGHHSFYTSTPTYSQTKNTPKKKWIYYYRTTSKKRGLGGIDPKKVIKEHFNKLGVPWEYTSEVWEEEEIHCNARTYDEVIFKR
jgi:hypothetical protein